ncbi:unnamed protein product [Ambrosiozyma monospora]|uniref:Unnamed protein product n=1 Tax=Ambrosiozyma monospora TaxID=43982 RepID=A0ACB5TRR0_AMBMO|nr:unnamed protein product [Ambrosiozyma monospora]
MARGDINRPPYTLSIVSDNGPLLDSRFVAPNATHVDGALEYDLHNLYGYSESKATYKSLQSIQQDKRPFILSRSTHSGSGQYAAHWGGDNESVWSFLRFSISQSFSFGLFGIPFFGADVCGFTKNTTEEMCSRWMQLGSFFPFYRNHNTKTTIAQEPYVWDSVAETSKNSIQLRYTLLPYYYTLLAHSHLFDGLPVMRASSWVFPYDESLFGLDSQFFIGNALLVVPALLSNVTSVSGTFPGLDNDEIYYNWYDKKVFNNTDVVQTLDAPLNGDVPLFVRGGFVLPLQDPAYTISESRENPFRLIAALDANGDASGDLFLDDGESPLDSNYEG